MVAEVFATVPGVSIDDIESGARAICKALGLDPDQKAFQGPPMRLPWVMEAHVVPSTLTPVWQFYRTQSFAVLQDAKRREKAK